MAELNPCPFCKASGDTIEVLAGELSSRLCFAFVQCWKCETTGPRMNGYPKDKVAKDAIAKWNVASG